MLKSLRSLFSFDNDGGLKDRLLTAVIVLAIAVGLTILAIELPLGGLVSVTFTAAIAILSCYEVARLFARDQDTLAYRPVYGGFLFLILSLPTVLAVLSGVSLVVTGVANAEGIMLATQGSAIAILVMQVLAGRTRIERASSFGERIIPAFLLVGICAPQLVLLSSRPMGIHYVWWLAAVVALNDAGAYFTGRSLGRHKIAPALSPNKTVEGSVAGLIIGATAAALFGRWILGGCLDVGTLVALGLVVTIAAQAGDLSKSYLKRLRGVKDTGSFFPGHGGILDRFDGMIAGAPVMVIVLRLCGVI